MWPLDGWADLDSWRSRKGFPLEKKSRLPGPEWLSRPLKTAPADFPDTLPVSSNHHSCILEREWQKTHGGLQCTRMQGGTSGLTLEVLEIAEGFRSGEQTVLQGRGWVEGDPGGREGNNELL